MNQDMVAAGYDRIAQGFHWITAALILFIILPVGLTAAWIGDGPLRSYLLDHWHKPFGMLIIALTVPRLIWKASQPSVPAATGLQHWEHVSSKLAHWLLYALLLAMPISGLMMSQGAGRPTSFFGLFNLPQILALDPALAPREQVAYKAGKLLHGKLLNWILYVTIFLHIAGALKHRYVDGDRAFLRRMWGKRA